MVDEKAKGIVYISNGFSPAMLSTLPLAVEFHEVGVEEFCNAVKSPGVINSIGHQGTTSLINGICNSNLSVNRIQIKVSPGDTIYVITLLTRLEEGRILKEEEMKQLLAENKIKFIKVRVFNAVLGELSECGRTKSCDEKYYDYLAAKTLS